jgi:hypothetical protein
MKNTLLAILVVLLAGCSAFGQALSGTIVGTVTDPAGAVVASAKVTLTNIGTSFARTVETNQDGHYVASSFPTGKITVTVEQPGFQKLVRTGAELTAADTLTIDLALQVGNVQQTVEINAEATLLQTEEATISSLVSNQQILQMPLNGRMFTQLIMLMPGTTSAAPALTGGFSYNFRGITSVSINGSQSGNNSYLIDGMYNKGLWLNNLVINPTIDSIQETRVMSSNYSAQYGDAAGGVTVVQSKSGTNNYHGSLYEFLRNDKLDANTFFNNRSAVAKNPLRRNEFGGTIGGPIRKDKTFIFGDYQGIRLAQSATVISSIPTLAQQAMVKTGDFSAFPTQIFDPNNVVNGLRQPFVGNVIPKGQLDQAAVKLFGYLPAPTSSAATQNYAFTPSTTQRTDQFDVRGDQNFGASDRLFLKYSYDNSFRLAPGNIPAPASAQMGPFLTGGNGTTFKNWAAAANYTKVFGPTVVNETRLGAVRWNFGIQPTGTPFTPAAALGIPGINISDTSGGLPGYTIASPGFTIGDASTFPEFSRTITYQLENITTIVKGSHTIKFGGRYLRNIFNGFSAFPTRGTYNFSGQFTRQVGGTSSASALADFALGAPNTINRGDLSGVFGIRFYGLAVFAEDSWRVNNKLTVNLGLRYEIQSSPFEVHDRWANFDGATGKLLLAGLNGNSRSLRDMDKNNFGPRLGIAYQANSKTIVRTGFGISYTEQFDGGTQIYKNLPFLVTRRFTYDQNGAPGLLVSQGLPPLVRPAVTDPALNGGNPYAYPRNFQTPKVLQWSFGIQREIMPGILLDTSYVGTRGLELMAKRNLNQPFPGSGDASLRRPFYISGINTQVQDVLNHENWGGSKYHSLQVRLQTRAHHGLTAGLSYTWSHSLANAGENQGGTTYQDSRNLKAEWGNSNVDRRHVLVINHVYELPFGSGRTYLSKGLLGHIVGNWNLSGVWSMESGLYFTPRDNASVSNAQDTSNGGPTDRPNRVADGNLPSDQRTIAKWFDTSAFVVQTPNTFGNAGNFILVGPGYFNVDAGIHRDFRITEGVKAAFRWEMFNAFNHANFNNPNANFGNPLYGQITGTQASRSQQVALKLTF